MTNLDCISSREGFLDSLFSRCIARLALCAILTAPLLIESGAARPLLPASSSGPIDGSWAVHRNGAITTSVTNRGTIGRGFTPRTVPPGVPGFEFPPGSHIEYLFAGSIWIGGIVNDDTLVSVSHDGWQFVREFIASPESPNVVQVTGPADINFRAKYTDTLIDPRFPDPIDGPHRPLNLRITQTSRHWIDPAFDDFIIIEYLVENFGPDTIQQMWFGLYLESDVWFDDGKFIGFTDDYTGFMSEHEIAWVADNDGHTNLGTTNWDSTSQRGAIGAKFLDFDPPPVPSGRPVNFNWWKSNGDTALDWGPRLAGTIEDPYRVFRGWLGGEVLGTPEGDANKYYILSHDERDYDQIESALNHTVEGWLSPISPGATGFADGIDTRFLLSQGGVDLAPGETLKVVVALAAGHDVHQDPKAFFTLFDPFEPEVFTNTLDFSDLINNLNAADSLYQSGYNATVSTPPPTVVIDDPRKQSPTINWLYSENINVIGYDVYVTKIPNSLILCGVAPTDTPAFTSADIVNTGPITVDHFTLDDLADGAWYAVGVALSMPAGARVSVPALFKYGGPFPVTLDDMFANQSQKTNHYLSQPGSVLLSWTKNSDDAQFYNIYRFTDEDSTTYLPARVLYSLVACPARDLACELKIAQSPDTFICAYRPTPYATIPASQQSFSEIIDTAAKFHYQVTVVDSAGNESKATEPLTIYTGTQTRKKVAVLLGDSAGTIWLTRWDSVVTFYENALSSYQPEFLYRRESGTPLAPLAFSQVGGFEYLIIDGSGLSSAVIGSRTIESELWALDYGRAGGTMVYLGSGTTFGLSVSRPRLLGKSFDSTRTTSLFGIDSTLLISYGANNPGFSDDTLFHYFHPVGAAPDAQTQFPELSYHHAGFYTLDYLNVGPLPFKGIMFPGAENTELLYSYVSGRDPVSQLHGGAVGIKYTPESHTAYAFFFSPYEFTPDQADRFFRALLGDIQTDVGDDTESALLPKVFTLSQNYPNPFNPATTINYTVPRKAQVTLAVYNLLGQRVTTLVSAELPAGNHTVTWDASDVASGIYFYQLKSGRTKITKKALLLK
ncbi:MAG: T9SS type A sorting domain-containing protein [candidate division Zixibacteria bacterium]|nr:T9SS type A sorting domain-containing protein [candidate division Zixibacteria bacterium]